MTNDAFEPTSDIATAIKCKNCGADLKFAAGSQSLNCGYCNTNNEIIIPETVIAENDFNYFLDQHAALNEQQTLSTVKCDSCGASTTLAPNVTSSNCPYCDTPQVIKNASTCSVIKPAYMLPFKIVRNDAKNEFIKWVNSLWFAPNKLKDYAKSSAEKLKGVYMPYWTYDTNTDSTYYGLRGEYYYETQSYRDANGNVQTRQVQRTAWFPASGTVNNSFDDLLVCASNSLPQKLVSELEPWDLPELVSYNDKFLAGFITESYQTQLKEGFEIAKGNMQAAIKTSVKSDIGGDVQQIQSLNTNYNDIKFKHILLPLWISAYRYNNKVYRFTVNARTGEVQGERPYSAIKIFFFVLAILAILGIGIYFYSEMQN
ncbi:MAG: hypothetical protein HYX39_03045 [Bacteroidetes bacterium]|nr:hypothetical protein [Bacteroidota bacterium]